MSEKDVVSALDCAKGCPVRSMVERERDEAVKILRYARRMMKPDSDTAYVDAFLARTKGTA